MLKTDKYYVDENKDMIRYTGQYKGVMIKMPAEFYSKLKLVDLEWYVYFHDFNGQKIVTWNIFNNWKFKEDVEILLKDKKLNREEFAEKLKTKLMYCFWSKTEYEVIISPWVGKGDGVKIDIYDQVLLNFDRFVEYVWSFRKIKTK